MLLDSFSSILASPLVSKAKNWPTYIITGLTGCWDWQQPDGKSYFHWRISYFSSIIFYNFLSFYFSSFLFLALIFYFLHIVPLPLSLPPSLPLSLSLYIYIYIYIYIFFLFFFLLIFSFYFFLVR